MAVMHVLFTMDSDVKNPPFQGIKHFNKIWIYVSFEKKNELAVIYKLIELG